jgi:hypothetical protein
VACRQKTPLQFPMKSSFNDVISTYIVLEGICIGFVLWVVECAIYFPTLQIIGPFNGELSASGILLANSMINAIND